MVQEKPQKNAWWVGAGIVAGEAIGNPMFKKWMRRVFIVTAQGFLEAKDQIHCMYALTREELEDIVAEAKYIRSQRDTSVTVSQKCPDVTSLAADDMWGEFPKARDG